MCSFRPMMSLSSSPARLRIPSLWYWKRTVKSPCLTALRTSTRCSTSRRLAAERRSHSVTDAPRGGATGAERDGGGADTFRGLRGLLVRSPSNPPCPFAFTVMRQPPRRDPATTRSCVRFETKDLAGAVSGSRRECKPPANRCLLPRGAILPRGLGGGGATPM